MWAMKYKGEKDRIYRTCKAACDFATKLGISFDGGKDSLSMSAIKVENNTSEKVRSPISLNLSGVSKLNSTEGIWTPCLDRDIEDSCLVFLDLAKGKKRMRGSTFQSVFSISSGKCPDVDSVEMIKAFSNVLPLIKAKGAISISPDSIFLSILSAPKSSYRAS